MFFPLFICFSFYVQLSFKYHFYLIADPGDKEFRLDKSMYVVWAIGQLDSNKEPAYHFIYPKSDVLIHFNTSEPVNDCFSFTRSKKEEKEVWEQVKINDK